MPDSKEARSDTDVAMRSASFAAKMGYSVGNLGKSIIWTSFDIFLLYYLVRVAGFSPLTAGSLLTVLLIVDGCADIVVAYLVDRRGRSNAVGRLILVGAPLCGVGFWLIFVVPTPGPHSAIIGAVVVCRLGYTLCDIGHNTILVRIAVTARDTMTVSGMRLIFSAIGAGLVGLAATILLAPGTVDRQSFFMTAALIGSAVHIVTLLIARATMQHLPVTMAPADAPARRTSAAALLHDRPYRHVLALIAMQASLIPLFNRALPFLGETAHGNAGWAGTAVAIITASQALSLPAWMTLARWRSPASILIFAHGIMLFALGIVAVRLGGSTEMLGLALVGVAQAGVNMAIWALLALTVRNAVVGNAGNEALPIGLFLAVLKASAGLGNALLVASISAADRWYPSTAAELNAPMLLVAIMLPALGCVTSMCFARPLCRLDTEDRLNLLLESRASSHPRDDVDRSIPAVAADILETECRSFLRT